MVLEANVKAPSRVEMQRQDRKVSAPPSKMSKSISYLAQEMRGLRDELCDSKTYLDCLDTCFFYFFCYAFRSLLHSVTCCCCCCPCCKLNTPSRIKDRTARTHKAFAFVAKNLSVLWVSFLLLLFVRWIIFRPMDVKPHLDASTLYEFDLQSPPSGRLRFNVTANVLFHNAHRHYKIRYSHFAASVMYADVKLGPAGTDELPSFRQKPHQSTLMVLPLVGQLRNASGAVAETFARERVEGLLHMLVTIRVSLKYGFGPFKGVYFNMYNCPLQSPFPRMGGEPAVSSPAFCKTVDL